MVEPRIVIVRNRAQIYTKMKRYDDAYRECMNYLSLCEKVYGNTSSNYSQALIYLADTERLRGMLDKSAEHYTQSITIYDNILHKQLRYVPATNRTSYIKNLAEYMWKMSSFALDYSSLNRPEPGKWMDLDYVANMNTIHVEVQAWLEGKNISKVSWDIDLVNFTTDKN